MHICISKQNYKISEHQECSAMQKKKYTLSDELEEKASNDSVTMLPEEIFKILGEIENKGLEFCVDFQDSLKVRVNKI